MRKKNKVDIAWVQKQLKPVQEKYKYKPLFPDTIVKMNMELAATCIGTTKDGYFYSDGVRSRRIKQFRFYKPNKHSLHLDLDLLTY